MRKIIFRGFNVEDDVWVFGDLLQYRVFPVIMDTNCVQHECDALSIGQFTGLSDKQGKEVYEGDVVVHYFETDIGPLEHRSEVEYFGGAFYPICEMPDTEFEVIGNIYENPKLL